MYNCGCRSDNLRCPIECHAKTCHRQHGMDFCFECNEYPCDKQFEGKTREKWLERNNRMREKFIANIPSISVDSIAHVPTAIAYTAHFF